MKSLLAVALAALLAGTASIGLAQSSAAPASTPSTKPAATNPQNERMKACNEKAAGKKGDERKEFMSACLAGKEPQKNLTAQQQRMKDCNARAVGKTGDERKKFMTECLKG